MTGFWIGIVIVIAIVIGASVLIGKTLSGPRRDGERPLTRQQQMTALKASGAMRNRKESRR
jgi:hypothetical protein